MRFILDEVFDVAKLWAELPALAEAVDFRDIAAAILEEAGKVTSGNIAPLNRSGDEEGCQWNNGVVTTPAGFPEAYRDLRGRRLGSASAVTLLTAAWVYPR